MKFEETKVIKQCQSCWHVYWSIDKSTDICHRCGGILKDLNKERFIARIVRDHGSKHLEWTINP